MPRGQLPAGAHLRYLFISLLILASSACTFLPKAGPQPHVRALPPATSGTPAQLAAKVADRVGPGESGLIMISQADEALLWRLALADIATTSIDVQYFIWQSDATSNLLFDRLLRAADRGVRVRLIVDDLVLASSDAAIGAASKHPNMEIKLFNPGRVRESTLGAIGDFLLNFRQLNRRMHNKLFAVDNHVVIVGGRNIGDPYFGLSKKYNFLDLDVMAVGPVVPEVTQAFDEYWNTDAAYPGSVLAGKAAEDDLATLRSEVKQDLEKETSKLAAYPLQPVDWTAKLDRFLENMAGGEAHFIQDTPVTVGDKELRLIDMIAHLAEPSHEEVLIGTPYLIPAKTFLEDLESLRDEGVKVTIVTGSLTSNNHTAAHAHYKKYRKRLLAAGVDLYEFRWQPSDAVRRIADIDPVTAKFISLHTKVLVGDRVRCFIGSLNLDPRAMVINTENGLYIESPELCGKLAEDLRLLTHPDNAWRVYLDEKDRLRWESSLGTVSRQPARSVWQRIADFLYRLLPIESQL